jgi:YD repeat-containing protein
LRKLIYQSFYNLGCFAGLLIALMSVAHAQITNVTNDQATPVSGVGHDYIKTLNETVNPANGQVSLRLDMGAPRGRQLTIPLALLYNSAGVHHVNYDSNADVRWWQDTTNAAGSGWTYTLPQLTAVKGTATLYNSTSVPPTTYSCTFISNYVLQDVAGTRHALNIAISQTADGGTNCTQVSQEHVNQLVGGDDFVSASTSAPANGGAPTVPNPVTVSDKDGTVYYFSTNGFLVYGVGAALKALPDYVEDRNGNIATFSNSTGSYLTGTTNVTDSAGRTAVSITPVSSGANTVTVSGFASPFTLSWMTAPANFNTAFQAVPAGGCGNLLSSTLGTSVVRSVTLPNGKSYTFQYDGTYGLLSKVTYPGGGYISYSWGVNPLSERIIFPNAPAQSPDTCSIQYGVPAITHRYVSFDGVNIAEQQDFSYSTTWTSGTTTGWSSKQTTVTTNDLVRNITSQTIYAYSAIYVPPAPNASGLGSGGAAPVEQTITYKDWNSSTLRIVTKAWFDQYLLGCELVTLDNGMISGAWNNYSNAQLTDKKEYDYGLISSAGSCQNTSGSISPPASTPTRETAIAYQSFPVTPISGSIGDKPSSLITYSSGVRVAETDYAYDQTAVAGVSGPPVGHDETHYSASLTTPRGNLTTKTQKCFVGATSCTDVVSKYAFDETGQVASMIDPCGNATCADMTGTNHTTTYSYADSFSSGTPPGNTNAYLTGITNALGHASNYSYDYGSGQLTLSKDANNQSTTYLYNDPFGRPTQANYPDSGQTTFAYNDSPYSSTSNTPNVTITKAISSALNLVKTTAMDGMGHTVRTLLTSDPNGTDTTDTAYDGMGRVRTQSNPHRSTSLSTDGTSTFNYDAQGRVTSVVRQDGSTVSTSYSGNCTTVTDEALKKRKSCVDGLGRITGVWEDPSVLNYETDYAYDALDNLTTVTQKGGSTQANWRVRTFSHDSLSRLLSATNPESGTITYTYDANGNVITKADARNITTTMSYDALNRLLGKTYSDGTPPPTFYYDVAPFTWANQAQNATGRIVEATTGVAEQVPHGPI